MTIVPSIGTSSSVFRIASTAALSDPWRSPCPIVCAHATAACSTTLRSSSDRSNETLAGIIIASPCRRQFAARRSIGPQAQHVVRLHELVDFARALIDDRALAVAIEAAHRVLVGVAVGAVNLDGVTGGPFGGDGRDPLGQPRLTR